MTDIVITPAIKAYLRVFDRYVQDWRNREKASDMLTGLLQVSLDRVLDEAEARNGRPLSEVVPVDGRQVWDREMILDAGLRWVLRTGFEPTSVGWHRADGDHPSSPTVYRHFKNWAAFLVALREERVDDDLQQGLAA